MESEKPRVASVPTIRRVNSDKPRVPITAAKTVAVAANAFLLSRSLSVGSFSSAGSVPIRAPLTLDEDDDESGSGTDGDNVVSSEASNYSRGLESETDDGFESVSGDADDADVILGGIRVLGEELGGGIGDGSEVYRPFTGDIDEETAVNYTSLEEGSENSDEVGGISESEVSDADAVSVKAKVIIPRAIVSLDDDEFDESFSSDEEVALVRVIEASGNEESEVEDTGSQFEEMGMVEEPECSGSGIGELVSTEEEVARMNYSEKLEDGLISFRNIEELRLCVSPGGCNEGNSVEASMGSGGSFEQHIEKEIVQQDTMKDDDSGSIHEDDRTMKPGDVQGVEDSAVELEEMGMTDIPECSGSVTSELVSTKEDMQVNDGLLPSETIKGNSLGSDDDEATLAHVIKAPSNEEPKVKERGLQLGDMGMAEEQECLGSGIGFVFTEEEELGMNYSDKIEDNFISLGNIEELNHGVPPGGHNDFLIENEGNSVETSMISGESSKQLVEKEVGQRNLINIDDSSSIHENNAVIKPGDVEDSTFELGEMGMKPECSGFVTDELVFAKKDVQMKDGLVSFETMGVTILSAPPGKCNEFLVESEGKTVGGIALDETFSQLVEQGVGEGSISKENDSRINYGGSCDIDESMISVEGAIGLGKKGSGDEDSGNLIGNAQERWEDDCSAVMELEKPECKGEPEIGMICESCELTPTLNSVTTRNLEVARGIDVFVSGYGSSAKESENEGKQESELADIDGKLPLPYEDSERKLSLPKEDSSKLRSSFETANDTVEDEEQISEHINKLVNFQSDNELNQNSLGIEETSLRSVKDIERTLPENSSMAAYDIMENETQLARRIHNHTSMKLEEYEGTSDTSEKLPKSTFQTYFEELSSDPSVQLISGKVKERVEKTRLLKEKLQRIIKVGLSDDSAVTEVVSKPKLAGEEHQTSLGLDSMPDGTKIILPELKFPDCPDFSVNVLVIGKTGVGKSATINSIFGETKSPVGAFVVTTKSANYVVGNVGGILVRILDTPGLMSAAAAERLNEEVLMSIKKNMKMFPVDVILYIGRLDENPDIHLLRIITSSLGSSIWQNAIVVLTHAASDVSDSSTYKDYIAQRSSFMHQSIRQAVPELSCVDECKMPEILLAENNTSSFCGGKTSEVTCPDWRLKLLILCCSHKIQSKAHSLRKLNILVEKPDASPLGSFTLFCSLWNVLLLGAANPGHASQLHRDLKEKRHQILDSKSDILWDKQNREESLEQETLPVKNQEPEDEERRPEERTVLGCERTRRKSLGFQATKRFGIYLDTSELHTGFSIGDNKRHEEGEKRILVRMRCSSLAILGLVPMLMSVFNSVYGRKNI